MEKKQSDRSRELATVREPRYLNGPGLTPLDRHLRGERFALPGSLSF
jgi:hypothetical protein